MANEEYKQYLLKHRADFIKLTDLQEKELARLYIQTASEIKLRAADIINKQGLTYAQAKIRIKSLLLEASRLSDGFKTILDKSLIESADLGQEINKLIMGKYQDALKKEGINLNLGRILNKVNPEAVNYTFTKIYNDGLKLSDRLWLLERRSRQEIERIILQNVISGGSASNKVTISALENLLNPNYKVAKLTSLHGRKVGFEAARLLRTEMSVAYNEADRLSSLKNPGSTGLKWFTAIGACEQCDPLNGLSTEETGLPPLHPQCRCVTLNDVMPVDKFVDSWLEFMKDQSTHPEYSKWILEVYKAA